MEADATVEVRAESYALSDGMPACKHVVEGAKPVGAIWTPIDVMFGIVHVACEDCIRHMEETSKRENPKFWGSRRYS